MPYGPESTISRSLRAAIDAVDDQILALLDRRAEVVREVGRRKRERREAFHVPQRERAVLERLTAAANGAFPREAVRPVFREIMSACLSLESPLVVVVPGARGDVQPPGRQDPVRAVGALSARRQPGRGVPRGGAGRRLRRRARRGSVGGAGHARARPFHRFGPADRRRDRHRGGARAAHAHRARRRASSGCSRTRWRRPAARRGWSRRCGGAAVVAAPSAAAAAAMAREDLHAAALAPALAAELFDLVVAKPRLDDGPADVARFLVLGRARRRGRPATTRPACSSAWTTSRGGSPRC